MREFAGRLARRSRCVRGWSAGALVLAAGMIAAPSAFGTAGHFNEAPGSPIAVGEEPRNLVSGDFNGDCCADLAVAASADHSVTILLGDGHGGFVPAAGSPEPTSEPAVGIDSGDFDNDGDLDLAIASWGEGPSNVTILLGEGNGDFEPGPVYPGFGAATDLVVEDFDEDGDPDLAVVDLADAAVVVMLGDGSGGFAATPSPISVGLGPQAIAAGDLNGDAHVDLAVPNGDDGTVTLLLGDGSGGFDESLGGPLSVASSPRAIALAQLDGEPGDDIAVASSSSATVDVMLNDGSGDFVSAPGSPLTASEASYVEPVDLDGDGILDLAVAGGLDIFTFRNDGSGDFAPLNEQGEPVGISPLGIAADDYDGVGLPDLAVANFNSDDVTVLLNESGPSVAMRGRPFGGRASDDPSPSYELSSDDPEATFICRLDDGPWEVCDSPAELGPLADGEHRFRARAVDANGNVSRGHGHRRFVIDTELIDPEASIGKRQPQRGAKIKITGRAGAGEKAVGVLRARVRTGGRTYILDSARAELEPGVAQRLQATVGGAAAKRIKSAMASGRKPRVRAWLKVRDRAGNSVRVQQRLRLTS